jgi:hypothetical protein
MPEPPPKPAAKLAKDARVARETAALRENLRRRKEQARERAAAAPSAPPPRPAKP